MVYSPVDFAAYSRATGQPYPETPEERAAMVDDVRRFREQQLKRDEGPGLLESAAMGAGILGGLIGTVLAGKKLLAGRRKDPRTQSGRTSGKSGVEQVDLSVLRVADKEATPLQKSGAYVPPSKKVRTLVDVQETNEPFVRQQSTEAVDTGFDQKVQDLQSQIQRNEDLDIGSIDLDSSARRFFINEREAIANDLIAQGINPTSGNIELELAARLGSESSEYGSKYTRRKHAMQLGATYGGDLFENLKADSVQVGGINVPVSELKQPFLDEGVALSQEARREKARDFLGSVRLDITNQRNRRINDPETQKMLLEFEQNEEVKNMAAANADLNRSKSDAAFNESVYDAYDIKNEKLGRDIEQRINYTPGEQKRLEGAEAWNAQEQKKITATYPQRLGDYYQEGSRLYFELDPQTGEPIVETMERRSGYRPQVQNVLNEEFKGPASGTSVRGKSPRPFTAETKKEEGSSLMRQMAEEDPRGGIGIYGIELEGTPEGAISPGTAGDLVRSGTAKGVFLPNTPASRRRPTEPVYSKEEIYDEAYRTASAAPEGDVPLALNYEEVIESLGSQEPNRAAVNMSEAIRRAARERSQMNPRGGQIPQELEVLRRTMPEGPTAVRFGPRSRVAGLPPQQRTIPGVTGYGARQQQSAADKAAQQLESYMQRRMIGRTTPLTSEVVIQPKLF
jgi:hypothetical protein